MHKNTIIYLCGIALVLVMLFPPNTESKPREEVIPLCWNQTIPDVPMWHPAARCTGVINRTKDGISLTINLGRF